MKQSIIDKLGLTETDKWFGKGFIYNHKIYALPNHKEVYVYDDTDEKGKPKNNGIIVFFKNVNPKARTKATETAILDSSVDIVKCIIDEMNYVGKKIIV